MAHLRCDLFSDVLGLSTSITVLLPQPTSEQIGMAGTAVADEPPVLYLLHGLSDDDTTWLRRTSIERYAAPLGLAVVMPQVHRSFYSDEVNGNRYWTYLSEELPSLVQRFFRVSDRRSDTFVAGLSMGGYGAVKWALRQPERFAAAATLSGAIDVVDRQEVGEWRPELVDTIWGRRPVRGSRDDPFHLLAELPADAPRPELYVACGTDEPLLAENERFAEQARARGLAVTTSFVPGEHEWGLWDTEIRQVVDWLPLPA